MYGLSAKEMSPWTQFLSSAKLRWHWFRRLLPYLVWYGDELDVRVAFKDIGALRGDPQCIFETQQLLNRMGMLFDTGTSSAGRDWEWDYSLQGPISVVFRGRAAKPERRVGRPVLRVVSTPPPQDAT